MYIKMSIKSMLAKPAISGAIGSVAITQLSGGTQFIYNGKTYSLYALGFALGFGSSFVSELAHNYVLPHTPGHAKYQNLESMVLSLATSGGAFVLGARILNENITMQEARTFAIAGAASEVLSSYIATNWLSSDGTL
jgi:hypothetical protein